MTQYAYKGDAQFLAWGDGPQGAWIKLKLPDSESLEAFRGMTQHKAGQAGQILAVGIIEVQDGEQPEADAPEAPKGGALAKLAGMLCGDKAFQEWLRYNFKDQWKAAHDGDAAETAACIVRMVCEVPSRADLDHDLNAAQRFHDEIRKPWAEHNKEIGLLGGRR